MLLMTSDTEFSIYRPFYQGCDFCGVKFDAIGFMETYDEDLMYIAQKLNLTAILAHAGARKNKTPGSKLSQSRRIKEKFSLLDKEVRLRLYELYRIDFEMFGYDATSYL